MFPSFSGCIVKHWSPLLATAKAQQLLFRIVDTLLLPHNLAQQDRALRDSLPLYLQVPPQSRRYTRSRNQSPDHSAPSRACRWHPACPRLRAST